MVLFIALAWPAFAGQSEIFQTSGQAVVGAAAPWFSGWTVDEQVFNLKKAWADPTTERVALVFWATWCAPCREGMKRLCAAKAKLDAAGVKIVLVNVGEPAEKVRKFLKRNPMKFPVVVDPYGRAKKPFLGNGDGLGALPRTVVIGRDGKVIRIIGEEGPDYVEQIVK